jgi:Raf kinase inhibitor-like YbhB/YbcL family protein
MVELLSFLNQFNMNDESEKALLRFHNSRNDKRGGVTYLIIQWTETSFSSIKGGRRPLPRGRRNKPKEIEMIGQRGWTVFFFLLLMGGGFFYGGETMAFEMTSTAFQQEGMIPSRYTCDGEDISPPLNWSTSPSGTRSFALICDDPDAPAGTWVHWVVYNMPPERRGTEEAFPKDQELPDGTRQGKNDFRRIGYGGPCPPGGTHRYYFKLYALDAMIDLEPGATKEALVKAMQGHILEQTVFMGRYKR